MTDTSVQPTESTPSLEDLIEIIAREVCDERSGPVIARVESYDIAKQVCNCRPVMRFFVDGESLAAPLLYGVPVGFLAGSMGAFTVPVSPGDYVELTPQMVDHGAWYAAGTENQTSTTPIRSALGDAVARPGAQSPAKPLPTSAVSSEGPVMWGNKIMLGSSAAALAVALASVVNANNTLIEAHIHQAPSGPTGPALTPPSAPLTLADVESSKVFTDA